MKKIFMVTVMLSVLSVGVAAENDDQVSEAALVFDGVKPSEMRGGTWKVVYSSAEGPHGRVLETLTQRLGPYFLREKCHSTSLVLPLEKVGGPAVKGKRDMIIVGEVSSNPLLAKYVKEWDVPKDGYFIRTLHEKGRNIVAIAGAGPAETLYATFHFLDLIAPELERGMCGQAARYAGTFFRADKIPSSR
ncbi:MAG: hypothetical protein IJV91_04180, partial [Kiritimatiellae bacterium]|nr:hypothetical protein [Kiritimatiellia bacterium]